MSDRLEQTAMDLFQILEASGQDVMRHGSLPSLGNMSSFILAAEQALAEQCLVLESIQQQEAERRVRFNQDLPPLAPRRQNSRIPQPRDNDERIPRQPELFRSSRHYLYSENPTPMAHNRGFSFRPGLSTPISRNPTAEDRVRLSSKRTITIKSLQKTKALKVATGPQLVSDLLRQSASAFCVAERQLKQKFRIAHLDVATHKVQVISLYELETLRQIIDSVPTEKSLTFLLVPSAYYVCLEEMIDTLYHHDNPKAPYFRYKIAAQIQAFEG